MTYKAADRQAIDEQLYGIYVCLSMSIKERLMNFFAHKYIWGGDGKFSDQPRKDSKKQFW